MKFSLSNIGDPDDGDDTRESNPPWLENLSDEKKELRDAIYVATEDLEAHKHVEYLPDDKERALKILVDLYLKSDGTPYGSENGFNERLFVNVDEALAWFVLGKELNVRPARDPQSDLVDSPFSIHVDTERFGFFSKHSGFGFRITVSCALHNESGKFLGRRKGKTDLYPTYFRAAIAAIDVARDIKEDWFSHRRE